MNLKLLCHGNSLCVNVSRETPPATDERLERVIRTCRLTIYEQAYAFEEFELTELLTRIRPDPLALVRDHAVWSQLIPTPHATAESFALWRFHFPEGADNSGFMGWLAIQLKHRFGTGVFVGCAQNSADGGILDYWGCPWALRHEVVAEVQRLVVGEKI